MAKLNDSYNCILYEPGDEVEEKHGSTGQIFEIEHVEVRNVGIFPVQFLTFKGVKHNITHISNLFIPAGKSVEKYSDGLVYLNLGKVKKTKETAAKVGAKAHERLAKAIQRTGRKNNVLSPEDLKPIKRTFITQPPIKKKDDEKA